MPATRLPDKRKRLVDAASKLFHEQGFGRTTLADVAGEADVPLGNIYYYFKTKNALGEALVEQQGVDYRTLREQWQQSGDARDRLSSFLQMTLDNRRKLARSGCPIGSLCTELHKGGGPLPEQATRLFADWLAWLEDQFRSLGKGDESPGLAVHLLSVLQGATVLTHSFGDPRYVEGEVRRLQDWITTL